jgi:tryptophan 2,3-dioxygenase
VQAAEHEATLFGAIERWLERTPFVRLANFDFLAEYRAAVERMYDSDAALLARAFGADSPQYAAEHAKNRENRRDFLALFDAEQHAALQAKGLKTLSFRATQVERCVDLFDSYCSFVRLLF